MSFSVGIVGLPNVGKSTLFKALTKQNVKIASHPFTTIDPNVGKVFVPDERLKEIVKITNPEKVTPTTIEFVDIAGLVKNAHKGEGLGNQFLAQIRACDAIAEVIRSFENEKIEHVEKKINPKRDLEIIEIELLMKDLETVNKSLAKLEKESKAKSKEEDKKLNVLKKIKVSLEKGKKISSLELSLEEESLIKGLQLLTQKPIVYILNIDSQKEKGGIEKISEFKPDSYYVVLDLKLEREISELSTEEIKELNLKYFIDQLITACYNILDLITFFTVTGKETKAWTIKRGAKTQEAAGKVHTDFKEKFIKAEVIAWEELINMDSWKKAKEKGLIKIVGKDYVVQDGDVIEFKI